MIGTLVSFLTITGFANLFYCVMLAATKYVRGEDPALWINLFVLLLALSMSTFLVGVLIKISDPLRSLLSTIRVTDDKQ